MSTVMT
ncbi:hypothetical protein EE612_052036 [Oryza sativa]|nr:hypothetical protein EE612_052036 [Oryza sativa]